MKEVIKQILKDNSWEMEKDRYVIGLSNIDDIADEIVKLFIIPPVISSVCEHPYASLRGEEHGNPKCLKCDKNLT